MGFMKEDNLSVFSGEYFGIEAIWARRYLLTARKRSWKL